MRDLSFSKRRTWIVPLSLAAMLSLSGQAPRPEPVTDQETQLGDAAYKELKDKAEIIDKSPLYDALNPITTEIVRAAQPHYEHPFKFILVHEAQPNAFSVPGGNVYVTDALLYFVKNTEELAGTLCHEVAHTIHRDAMNRVRENQKILARELGALILLGPTLANAIAIDMIADLHSNKYSREIETSADITGSDICAAAGYNPNGLIWLFEDFKDANLGEGPEILSDHPGNDARIQALETHFRGQPGVFSKFNSDRKAATPLSVPENAPVIFLRK
jgi:predicted Zn-dependent protease